MSPPRIPLLSRIVRNCTLCREYPDCWIWIGSKTRDGYGVMSVGRVQHRAHRIAYEVFRGKIPKGMLVCHSCDHPLCVNPGHLFIGSCKDNTQDMIKKGRDVRLKGSDHPNTKVTPAKREEIRKLRSKGFTLKKLGKMYDVSFQTISAICNRSRNYATG